MHVEQCICDQSDLLAIDLSLSAGVAAVADLCSRSIAFGRLLTLFQ
jgi:hypothetical protein